MIRILVVDDEAKLTQSVCAYLNDSGYEAKGCLSAEAAYDAMYSQLYDLIISDIMMPGTDGFEFAKTVRSLNKTIPILFMSARDDLPAKQKGFDLGIDDYMVKPIDFSELLMRVRALLRRANIEASRKLTVGTLVLDADALTAAANGEEIPVTTREFNIIYKLLSYPNHTFPDPSSWMNFGAWRAIPACGRWMCISRSCGTSSPCARTLKSRPFGDWATRRWSNESTGKAAAGIPFPAVAVCALFRGLTADVRDSHWAGDADQ